MCKRFKFYLEIKNLLKKIQTTNRILDVSLWTIRLEETKGIKQKHQTNTHTHIY